jgi:hypothetical protein
MKPGDKVKVNSGPYKNQIFTLSKSAMSGWHVLDERGQETYLFKEELANSTKLAIRGLVIRKPKKQLVIRRPK